MDDRQPRDPLVDGPELVEAAEDNPEDTMLVALTTRDCALIGLGLTMLHLLCPTMNKAINKLTGKILECGTAQDFLPEGDEAFDVIRLPEENPEGMRS